MANRETIRIFISSPGDVEAERRRAALVIDRLARDYGRLVNLRPYLWEYEPMLASKHFQDVIDPPSRCDIVVMILWSRLGTPLPDQTTSRVYRGMDGRSPVTGTEWEFEDALQANRDRGSPDLLVYRSRRDPPGYVNDQERHSKAIDQWRQLEGFWQRHFADRGQFKTAYGEFHEIDEFTRKLERDLRVLIERRLRDVAARGSEYAAPLWLGNPFRALEAYGFEHASVFFGRAAWIERGTERLAARAKAGTALLLVVGASGAGKSSLVQAGILPALFTRGVIEGIGLWRRVIFRPGLARGSLFMGLADALLASEADGEGLPELIPVGTDPALLARELKESVRGPFLLFHNALKGIEEVARAGGRMLPHEKAGLVLVVDQLEEIFTIHETPVEERRRFVQLLGGLARSGSVYVVATLRSDFWHRVMDEVSELVTLTEDRGRIELLAPSPAELAEMIRRPAEEAGLEFEEDQTRGVRLDAELAEAASHQFGALPLLSAVLDGLYQDDVERGGGRMLTYATYHRLGRLTGAIARRAEDVLRRTFESVPADRRQSAEDRALARMLRALATAGHSDTDGATARATRLSDFTPGSPEQLLVNAMLQDDARLLVADGNDQQALVRVAHEALLTRWERAQRQLSLDRRDLETRMRVEQAAGLWRSAEASVRGRRLLRDVALAEAEDLADRWRSDLDPGLVGFICLSAKMARRRRFATWAAVAGTILGFAAIAGFAEFHRRVAEEQTELARTAESQAVAAQEKADRDRNAAELASAREKQSAAAARDALEKANKSEQVARRSEERALSKVMSDALLWTAELHSKELSDPFRPSANGAVRALFLFLDSTFARHDGSNRSLDGAIRYTDAEGRIIAASGDEGVTIQPGRKGSPKLVSRFFGSSTVAEVDLPLLRPQSNPRYVLLFLEGDRHAQNRSFATWSALNVYDRQQGTIVARIAADKVNRDGCYFATHEKLADQLINWRVGGSAVDAGMGGPGIDWAGFIDASGWGVAYLECRPVYAGINYGFGGTPEGLFLFHLPIRNEAPEPAAYFFEEDKYSPLRCFLSEGGGEDDLDSNSVHLRVCDEARANHYRRKSITGEKKDGSQIIPRFLISTDAPDVFVQAAVADAQSCLLELRRPDKAVRATIQGFACQSLWEEERRENILLRVASNLSAAVILAESGGSGGWRQRLFAVPIGTGGESIACTMGSGQQNFALVGRYLVAKCYSRDRGLFAKLDDMVFLHNERISSTRSNVIIVVDVLRLRIEHEIEYTAAEFDLISGVALSPEGDRLAVLARPKSGRRAVYVRHLPTRRTLVEHRFAEPIDFDQTTAEDKLSMEVAEDSLLIRVQAEKFSVRELILPALRR